MTMTPLEAAAIRYAEAKRAQEAETDWPRFLEADERKDDALQALKAAALALPPSRASETRIREALASIDTPGGSANNIGDEH